MVIITHACSIAITLGQQPILYLLVDWTQSFSPGVPCEAMLTREGLLSAILISQAPVSHWDGVVAGVAARRATTVLTVELTFPGIAAVAAADRLASESVKSAFAPNGRERCRADFTWDPTNVGFG